MLTRFALGGGAGIGLAAALALALTAWARCSDHDLGHEGHPLIRAWDAGARDR